MGAHAEPSSLDRGRSPTRSSSGSTSSVLPTSVMLPLDSDPVGTDRRGRGRGLDPGARRRAAVRLQRLIRPRGRSPRRRQSLGRTGRQARVRHRRRPAPEPQRVGRRGQGRSATAPRCSDSPQPASTPTCCSRPPTAPRNTLECSDPRAARPRDVTATLPDGFVADGLAASTTRVWATGTVGGAPAIVLLGDGGVRATVVLEHASDGAALAWTDAHTVRAVSDGKLYEIEVP